MLIDLRKSFCFVLALSLAFTPAIRAQQSNTPSAPVPPQIAAAHSVFIANGGGPDRAYSRLYSAMQGWGRYQLVDSPGQANLIFEIHDNELLIDAGGPHTAPVYNSQLSLRILDAKTNALLWTVTSNIREGILNKTRNKNFDRAVAILVDRTRQLDGEQLTAAQQKTIADNNRLPTSTKVIFGVAIGGAAVATALIIHAEATRKQPMLPNIPAQPCITPTFCPA
jgi:hypothetical protein